MSDELERNLRALAASDAARAAAVRATPPGPFVVETAASGVPTLLADGILLHSRHDPAREAQRWALAACERLAAGEGEPTAVVLGLGLGWHVEALAACWRGRIVVIEPDDALVRVACATRDLTGVFARVVFAPATVDAAEVERWTGPVLLPHGPSLLRPGTGLKALRERLASCILLSGLRLRVLVVSPLHGGSYPITSYCARALTAMGHEVTTLDLAPFAAGMHAIDGFSPKPRARRVVHEAYGRFLGAGVLAAVEAQRPDLVLAMAQAPLDGTTIEQIRALGAVTAFWFVEDHRLFPYWREVAGAYDHFFVIQDEPFLSEARGVARGTVEYLPLAADPVVHRPLVLTPEERAEFAAPVAFVGAGYRNRRVVLRTLLERGLRVWGSEWTGSGALDSVVQRDGARVSTEDCVRIFNATDVNLNLHSSTWVDGVDPQGDFVNPRTFELAAVGAFQLVDERRLLPPLFSAGHEVATFREAGELPDLVRHYLARPDERAAIAAAGRRRVLAEHTYRHRMEQLLAAVCARDGERLRAAPREPTAADVARLEGDSALGRFLVDLPAHTPFTLDGVVRALQGRSGDLCDAEAILLLLHQFDEMYVQEARR